MFRRLWGRMFEDPHDRSAARRAQMVEHQLRARGIRDLRVLEAMSSVPREPFLPPELESMAYDDRPLPIGSHQTISQPYIVAYMLEQLMVLPHHRVLEVGTGTGYQAAVLAHLACEVYTIERIAALYHAATRNLERLGLLGRVHTVLGDGTEGLAEAAPFNRIVVAAGAPEVPAPLVAQLADEGVMVVPIGSEEEQVVMRIAYRNGAPHYERLLPCRFVKLIGEAGWASAGRTDESGTPQPP